MQHFMQLNRYIIDIFFSDSANSERDDDDCLWVDTEQREDPLDSVIFNSFVTAAVGLRMRRSIHINSLQPTNVCD